ncbi:MAG: hypothetical protein WD830_12160 [Chloroflexota bacterium]
MSKRVRGTARAHRRPGARPPSERSAARGRTPSEARSSQLEAAEVIAEEIVEERTEEAPAQERGATRAGTRLHHKVKAGSLLAARAATEYVYVSQDMRRIALVAGSLVVLLFTLWLLVVVLKVIPLPFY